MDIRLQGIAKSYEGHVVLEPCDLSVPSGGVLVLEGANGTGKTTLLEAIVGLVTPDRGTVQLGGRDVTALRPYERGCFYVPQTVHKFWALQEEPYFCYLPAITVRENIEQAARRDDRKTDEYLRLFGLYGIRRANPADLSRGQKQRLALARAFLSQQPVILLDEPMAAIDPSSRQDLIETLAHLQRRYRRTLVFVTQHPDELRDLDAHRVSLRDGRIAPGYGSQRSLTSRVLGRALRELATALTVDSGDRLEAAAIGGRKPSEALEWIAARLREREARLSAQAPTTHDGAGRRLLAGLRQQLERLGRSRAAAAELTTLRQELSQLRAAVDELQRGPATPPPPAAPRPASVATSLPLAAPLPAPAATAPGPAAGPPAPPAPEPRRIMHRLAAPWINEPLAETVWRPGRRAPARPAAPAGGTPSGKRRILLLRCPSLMYNYHGIPPFGLATITAELRAHGHDIVQDDLDAKIAHAELFPRHRWGRQYPAKEVVMDIARMRRHWEGRPDVDVLDLVETVLAATTLDGFDTVALSCVEGDDYAAILTMALGQYLRRQLGKTVIVGGEAFPHMQPIKSELKYFLENGCLDHYIQGNGEAPLLELFRRLDEGLPLEETPGLVTVRPDGTLRENRPQFTRPEVVPNFDGLPMPLYYKRPEDWDNFRQEEEGVDEILVLPLKTNYCCPNKCAFCIQSGDTFTQVTTLEPEVIVGALRELKARHNTSYFMFADDMFNVSARWTERVADALIEADLGVLWSDCAYARNMTPELLVKLRRAGAIRLVWGLETASPRLQTMINKGLDLAELERTLQWSHEAGIYNAVQIIAGLPTERDEDIETTIAFLRRNQPHIDQVFLNPFSLITGSLMHKHPERFGISNVQPVATIFRTKPDEVYSWIQRYTFDTEGDLPWKEKVKQIEESFRRMQECLIDLDLGGHDIHTLMLRFARYKEKRFVKDFQSARRHQGFDYFGEAGERGHSPTGAHL